jgi:hypothetical protein
MPGMQIGYIVFCTKCAKSLQEMSDRPVPVKPITVAGLSCIWCGEKSEDVPMVEVPAMIAKDYAPSNYTSTQNPEGEPWYITGYLDS